MVLLFSLLFLTSAGVMLCINGLMLMFALENLSKTRLGLLERLVGVLQILSFPFVVFLMCVAFWVWQDCPVWYGNGDVWTGEGIYFICAAAMGADPKDKLPSKKEKMSQTSNTKPLLEGNHE